MAFARVPFNWASFRFRSALAWSRGTPKLAHESKDALFHFLSPEEQPRAASREVALRTRYDLEPLASHSTQTVYRTALSVLDRFDALPGDLLPTDQANIRAAEVGCADWHYVFALERWLRHSNAMQPRTVELHGIEIDGHGIYKNFYARCDHARAYAAQTGNASLHYHVKDFLAWEGADMDVVVMLFPFLVPVSVVLWGLPLRCFQPAAMLSKAASVLRSGGLLLIMTYTDEETRELERLAATNEQLMKVGMWPARSNLVNDTDPVDERVLTAVRRM